MDPVNLPGTTSADGHFAACWRQSNCQDCIEERAGCGWCPTTRTCVPAASIFAPVTRGEDICPYWAERWELRTRGLGCGCSTLTLLSVIVTVAATLVALVLLYGAGVLPRRLNRVFGTGTRGGWEVEVKTDGARVGRRWTRKPPWRHRLATLWRRADPARQSEQEVLTERTRLLG